MENAVVEFKNRRRKRLSEKAVALFKMRRDERLLSRFDDDDEAKNGNGNGNAKKSGGHGNTRIPFGLCQREGIKIADGWTPQDAWDALADKGYKAGDVYRELKETGKVGKKSGGGDTKSFGRVKRPPTKIDESMFPGEMVSRSAKSNTMIAVDYVNSHCDDGLITDFIGLGADLPEPPNFKCVKRSSGEGCCLETWTRRSTGEIARAQITVPNFSKYTDEQDKASAIRSFVHEWTHYLDDASSDWGNVCFSGKHQKLIDAMKNFDLSKMSDEVKNIFAEYDKQFQAEKERYRNEDKASWKTVAQQMFGEDTSKWPEFLSSDGKADMWRAAKFGYVDEALNFEKKVYKYRKDILQNHAKKKRGLMDGVTELQGIYDSLSGGEAMARGLTKWGHTKSYFMKGSENKCAESLAEYVALRATNPKLAEVFSRNFPDIADALDEVLDDMIKKVRGAA